MSLADVLKTEVVRRVFQDLHAVSKRRVDVRPMGAYVRDFPDDPEPGPNVQGLCKPTDSEEIVYLRADCGVETVVHEALHGMLWELGYPEPDVAAGAGNYEKRTASRIKNALEHPEIFRRMTELYGLDLSDYFADKVRKRSSYIQRLEAAGYCDPDDPQRIDDFFFLLDLLYFGQHGRELVEAYRRLCPETSRAVERLFRRLQRTGFETPQAAYRSGQELLRAINEYAKRHHIDEEVCGVWRTFALTSPPDQAASKKSLWERIRNWFAGKSQVR